MGNKRTKKSISLEGFVFLTIFLGIFGGMGMKMGGVNMLNTLMNTGYQLLLETVFYIMAIAVLAGAISGLFSEFGVISMVNKLLSPLMKPLYNLPGAAALGVITTFCPTIRQSWDLLKIRISVNISRNSSFRL